MKFLALNNVITQKRLRKSQNQFKGSLEVSLETPAYSIKVNLPASFLFIK